MLPAAPADPASSPSAGAPHRNLGGPVQPTKDLQARKGKGNSSGESSSEGEEEGGDEAEKAEEEKSPSVTAPFFSTAPVGAPRAAAIYSIAPVVQQPPGSPLTKTEEAAVWQEVTDKATGDSYFWNATTGETSWNRPGSAIVNPPGVEPPEAHVYAAPETYADHRIPASAQFEPETTGKARRARDRDLERHLEAGNFDALGKGEASVLLQPDTSAWNPHRNGAADTKQSEVKIASLSYDPRTGESTTSFNPSKVQKRKHQINSLAVSAAQRELELMEKKGNSLKTKAQTQAKYGW